MDNLFEKKYKNEEIKLFLSNKMVNVITFKTRSLRVIEKEKIDQLNIISKFYVITYNPIDDTFTEDSTTDREYNLISETNEFLSSIDNKIPLIIDITNIDIRVLGIFLYQIKKINFKNVFCLYITPKKYNKNPKYLKDDSDGDNQFDLYNGMGKRIGINGYLVDNDDNLLEKNIILMGFEGDRAKQLCEEGNINVMLPVITLPAINPGWQNYALIANKDILRKLSSRNSVEYVAADSILSVYRKMHEWKKVYKDSFLRISPLGTKINALGVLLYILNNPKSYDIFYDNPIQTKSNTTGIDSYLYYDISDYLNNDEK